MNIPLNSFRAFVHFLLFVPVVLCSYNLGISAEQYRSHVFENETLIVETDRSIYRISFVTPFVAKIVVNAGDAVLQDSNFGSIQHSKIAFLSTDNPDTLVLDTGNMRLHLAKDPFTLQVLDQSEQVVVSSNDGFELIENELQYSFRISEGEVFQGTGSRAIASNRNGRNLSFYNRAVYGFDVNESLLNITIPVLISNKGYGLFFDEHHPATMDIGNSVTDQLLFQTEDNVLTYYVIVGNNYDRILREFTALTGRQPIPPRWALGYIQSKFGYETELESRSVIDNLRSGDFPVDAIVMDLQWMGGVQQMGQMDWDRSRFPTPFDMLSDFKRNGVNTICIFEPYVTRRSQNYAVADNLKLFTENSSGESYRYPDFWAGEASLLDLSKAETRDWWWQIYKNRMEEGLEAVWSDLGEPETDSEHQIYANFDHPRDVHNIYSLIWADMLDARVSSDFPKKRLFNLIRSGWAGMQRHRTFPWSGDVARTYSGMAIQIPLITGMSMSGVGYMHCDIGGFTNGPFNSELYARWMQLGTFLPVMRVHGTGIDMEPYNYPEPYRSICRSAMKLRYELLPYNYTLAFWNSYSGRPLMLPMNYFNPQNEILAGIDDQFFWGESILVAPVLSAGQETVDVQFPGGTWIDPDTLQRYKPFSSETVAAPIEKIPYFIKAGSFIPKCRERQSTQFYKNDHYHLQFYVDPDRKLSTYMIYEDDGESENTFSMGKYRWIECSAEIIEDELTIRMERKGPGYEGAPQQQSITLELLGVERPSGNITVAGQRLMLEESFDDYHSADSSAYWDSGRHTLWVKFNWSGDIATLSEVVIQEK